MAKRKATRKRTAEPSRGKAKSGSVTRKKTKTTRKIKSPRGAKTKGRATKKAAVKKTARSKKIEKKAPKAKAAKKKAAKVAAGARVAKKKKAAKVAAGASVAKKKKAAKVAAGARVAKKKKAAKVAAGARVAKKKKTAKVAAARRAPAPVPEEPGLPLKEVRARLGLVGGQIADFEWLEGLYMHGSQLLEAPRLERVDFIAVFRGLRNASRLKSAEAELRELLAAVLPLDFDLKLTGTLEIGRLLNEGNPAAQALLGYAESVFSRAG